MPDTARRYGLIVDQFVDQRLDFEKSTQAAVRYLQDLYKDLGSWTLVAAAYNRGENGLVRDLARQGVDSYFDAYLNSETSRYVFRIVALKYVLENKYNYFGADVLGVQYNLPDTKTIRVGQIDNIAVWAKERGYTYLQIRQLNPWIIGNQLPDGAWEIKVFD